MDTYRKNYQQPPDSEGLEHIRMTNSSSALDYDKIRQRMVAAEDHIRDRTQKILMRILNQDSEK